MPNNRQMFSKLFLVIQPSSRLTYKQLWANVLQSWLANTDMRVCVNTGVQLL